MNIDLNTADYLSQFLAGNNSKELFAATGQDILRDLEQDVKHAADVMEDQQQEFEQAATPLIERIVEANLLQAQQVEIEELQQKLEELHDAQERIQVGINTKNQELTKLTTQIASSQLAIQNTIKDLGKQKTGSDPRFETLNNAVTTFIREF